MDKPVFYHFDERLSAAGAADCSLYAIIGTDGFSILVTSKQGECLALQIWQFSSPGRDFRDAEEHIRVVFGSEKLLAFPYGRVYFALANANATLVPRRLFNKEDLPAYLKLLLQPADYSYGYDGLPELDCFLVYAAEEAVFRTCAQYFPHGIRTHLATPLIRASRALCTGTDYEIMINFRNQQVQILVFDRQNLLFFNTFRFTHPNDLLYSVLLVFDQFRLNPLEIQTTIFGNLLEDSDIYRLLYRYIRRLKFASMPYTNQLPESARDLPPHFFFDLYAMR